MKLSVWYIRIFRVSMNSVFVALQTPLVHLEISISVPRYKHLPKTTPKAQNPRINEPSIFKKPISPKIKKFHFSQTPESNPPDPHHYSLSQLFSDASVLHTNPRLHQAFSSNTSLENHFSVLPAKANPNPKPKTKKSSNQALFNRLFIHYSPVLPIYR